MHQPDHISGERTSGGEPLDDALLLTFVHPDDVLNSRALSLADKRAILASWASDAHAVPNLPAMRQLDSGAIVSIDTVLSALRTLDAREPAPSLGPKRGPWARRNVALLSRWRKPPGRDDGDDDPPPCPAAALHPSVERALRCRRDAAWNLVAA